MWIKLGLFCACIHFLAVTHTRATGPHNFSVLCNSHQLHCPRDQAECAAKWQNCQALRALPSGMDVTDHDLGDNPPPVYTKDTRHYRGSSARFPVPSHFGTKCGPHDITAGDETMFPTAFMSTRPLQCQLFPGHSVNSHNKILHLAQLCRDVIN